MKALKRDLQSIVKSLRSLTKKTERIAIKIGKLARSAKRPKAKARAKVVKRRVARKAAARKSVRANAMDTIMGIIKKHLGNDIICTHIHFLF